MLKSIRLKNYKRFENFSISLREGNILVGPNNCGKSSILDAFRLLEAGSKQLRKNPTFINSGKRSFHGYYISEQQLPFDLSNVVRNYDDDDAEISVTHQNGSIATFLLHPNERTRFYISKEGRQPLTASSYRNVFPSSFLVVPTLGPLEIDEKVRTKETIDKNIGTRIAARNFRNIWKFRPPADFNLFRERIEFAWPGITIEPPEIVNGRPQTLRMFYKENRIPREIQWAGFGFQIWLQIQTHLARKSDNSILVLDEPDIYLHPSLQHILYHDIKENFSQYIVATHATEIINEAETKELIVIDPLKTRGSRINTDGQYSAMLDYVGSAQNADFAKISRAKKVIFVEGEDDKILRSFSRRIGLTKLASSNKTPIQKLGGFSQFIRAKNTVWAFKEILGVDIKTVCLFDSDFRSKAEIDNFINDMTSSNQRCFVLSRKEIENYLIDVSAMTKAIEIRLNSLGKKCPLELNNIVRQQLDRIFEEHRNNTFSQRMALYLTYHSERSKNLDNSTLINKFTKEFDEQWSNFKGRVSLVPGKEVIKNFRSWLQDELAVSLTPAMIIAEMKVESIPADLRAILNELNEFM